MKFGRILLLHITVLFNHIQILVWARGPTITHIFPTHILLPYGINTTAVIPAHNSNGVNDRTQIIATSKFMVISRSVQPINTRYLRKTTILPTKYHTTSTTLKPSSSWSTSTTNPKSPSMSHPTPSTPSPSPTHKIPPAKTTKSSPLVHKVGLIVGVVLGTVILSVCLIVFHKKETRLKCLKLLCRPCTKNYSSRYNIVPIYVYDDNEQDIRELQDDSDLPLV